VLMEIPVGWARSDAERWAARRVVDTLYAFSRFLIGDQMAEQLGYPRASVFTSLLQLSRFPAAAMYGTARALPPSRSLADPPAPPVWCAVLEQGLAGHRAEYAMPASLTQAETG